MPVTISGREKPAASTRITDHLEERVGHASVIQETVAAVENLDSEVRALRAYVGGLPAELISARLRRDAAYAEARKTVRKARLGAKGRRIDLPALLRQCGKDRRPLWALVDPMRWTPENDEGKRDSDGTMRVSCFWVRIPGSDWKNESGKVVAFRPEGGIPPIPETARKLFADRIIRRDASWVGLLYQPDSWREANPDPAVVVEWKSRPGEYYCLAVWGDDAPTIMEWVD